MLVRCLSPVWTADLTESIHINDAAIALPRQDITFTKSSNFYHRLRGKCTVLSALVLGMVTLFWATPVISFSLSR